MAKTYDQAITEVRYHIKRKSEGYEDDRIGTNLNFSQEELAEINGFSEMRTSFSGSFIKDQKTYSLPSNVCQIISISLQDGASSRKLERWTRDKFEKHYPRPESYTSGRPWCYVQDGSTFEIYFIPNSGFSYRLWYFKYASEWTSGNTSDFNRKDKILIAKASELCLLDLMETEEASYWGREYNKGVGAAIRKDKKEGRDQEFIAEGFPSMGEGVTSSPEANPMIDSW